MEATDHDISIVCGACPLPTEMNDASSASTLVAGVVTAVAAGMAAIASSAFGLS